MPLARIITSAPTEVLAIVNRLRAHGYTVETVLPGGETVGPADLELTVEREEASKALPEIVQRTAQGDFDVYIAAGALHSPRTSVKNPSLSADPPTVADTMNGVAAGLQNKRDLLARALREQRAQLRQARHAERARQRELWLAAQRSQTVPSDLDRSPNSIVAGPLSELLQAPEVSFLASQTPEGPLTADSQVAFEREEGDLPPTETKLPTGSEESLVPEESPVHESALLKPNESVEPQEVEGTVSDKDLVQSGAAPVAADSEAHVETVRGSLKPGAQETVGAEFAFAAGSGDVSVPVAPVPVTEAVVAEHRPRRKSVRVVIRGGKRISRRAREWRAAVLISCLFAALLMLGWAAVTREPIAPLPRSLSSQPGLEESTPFGAATLKPASGTDPVRAHRTSVPEANKSEKKNLHAQPASKNPAEKSARKVRRPSRFADDQIAEDKVIIHRLTPKPEPSQPVHDEKASLKRFSD